MADYSLNAAKKVKAGPTPEQTIQQAKRNLQNTNPTPPRPPRPLDANGDRDGTKRPQQRRDTPMQHQVRQFERKTAMI